jgi:hypothetical protein
MALIQISNQSSKTQGKKSTIRFTQSICPDCNMILDAEVFEREDQVFMSKVVQHTEKPRNCISVLMICIKNSVHTGLMEKVRMLQMLSWKTSVLVQTIVDYVQITYPTVD